MKNNYTHVKPRVDSGLSRSRSQSQTKATSQTRSGQQQPSVTKSDVDSHHALFGKPPSSVDLAIRTARRTVDLSKPSLSPVSPPIQLTTAAGAAKPLSWADCLQVPTHSSSPQQEVAKQPSVTPRQSTAVVGEATPATPSANMRFSSKIYNFFSPILPSAPTTQVSQGTPMRSSATVTATPGLKAPPPSPAGSTDLARPSTAPSPSRQSQTLFQRLSQSVIATVFGGVEVAEEHLPPKEDRLFTEEEAAPAAVATHSEAEKLVGPESTHFTPVRRSFADETSPVPILAAPSTAGSSTDPALTDLVAHIDSMTVADLKKTLTKYNVAFDPKAKRATLIKQLQELGNGIGKKQEKSEPKASGRKRSREDDEGEQAKKPAEGSPRSQGSPQGKKALPLPTEENTVAEIKAYAAAHGIDISKAKKKQQMLKLLGSK